MLAQLAARTVSGKTPPLAFRITLWILVVFFIGVAVAGAVTWWRLRRTAQDLPEGQERQGKSGQAGCLMAGAIPALLLGLFLLDWAIQVS
ncbi:hypothetical protein GCM10011492_19340 [Flexivirga endophytica]|uniref:Uncharacterized protein n=1 Tax=Flexivirga endophytica TaxID=1849103 RepID=A0A916WTH8_9MICO|nr:hypothetical protein [Flexivirga endophytica]GGB29124.1 hypothetical protein GCM10011492_19340 [Flexivirga endophytica]GHB50199.1 hypothetical protein GCM10008112_18610 [Flexivirga endophytica]